MKPRVSLIRQLLAAVFLTVSIFSFLVVILIAVKGGRFEFMGFTAKTPESRIWMGVAAFLGWFATRHGFVGARKAWMHLLKRVVLLSLSLSFSLFVAEIALRIYLRQTQGLNTLERLQQIHENGEPIRARSKHPLAAITRLSPNPKLIYELLPNLTMQFGDHELVQNGAGMRERQEYSLERLPSSVRIIGIGDSGMFGWDVEQDESYLSVLEELLNEGAGDVLYEVLNMGVPGYNTQQEVDTLEAKGLAYDPDIVILGWCENDTGLSNFVAPQKLYDEKDMSYLYALIFNRSRYQRIVLPDVQDRRKVKNKYIDPTIFDGEGPDGVVRYLRKLKKLSNEHDFKVLVFGPMEREFLPAALEEIGLEYFNTVRKIPAGTYPEEYKIHHPHPTAEGHAALAQHMEDVLREKGWLVPAAL